jgi:hypothetical protein
VIWVRRKKLTQTAGQTNGKRVLEGMEPYYYSRFNAATSCWAFRMRQGRMEPRGSGASQVGQRPRSNSLEILCSFCLLPFCWWVQEMQMLHSFCFPSLLPISTGTIYCVRTSKYCPHSLVLLTVAVRWQGDAEAGGQTETVTYVCKCSRSHSLARVW